MPFGELVAIYQQRVDAIDGRDAPLDSTSNPPTSPSPMSPGAAHGKGNWAGGGVGDGVGSPLKPARAVGGEASPAPPPAAASTSAAAGGCNGSNPFGAPTPPRSPPPSNPFESATASPNAFQTDGSAAAANPPPPANPFGESAVSANPFGTPPKAPVPPVAAAGANPFDAVTASVSSQKEARVVPPPAVEADSDGPPLPEHSPADMLRVIQRRTDPGAKEFLRSMRQAEGETGLAANLAAKRTSVVNAVGMVMPPGRESIVGGGIAKGVATGGNLFSKLTQRASKLKGEVDNKVKALGKK